MKGNQIKLAAILSYSTILFNILAGLIYTPWMVGKIGQSNYGIYTLTISLISMFILDFGLSSAVSRFISKYRVENNEQSINDFLGVTYKLYIYIDILIVIVLTIVFFMIERIYINLTIDEIHKLKIIYLISGLFSIISFPFMPLNGIIVANEKFIFLKSLDLLQKVLTVLLMCVSLLLGAGLYMLVIVNVGVGIVLIIVKLVYINKNIKHRVNFKCKNRNILKQIFSFSIWATTIGIFQRFILNITPSILGVFSGSSQIAIFSIGMTIEGYAYTLSTALSGLFLPKVTNLVYGVSNDSGKKLESLMIQVGRVQLFIIGAIFSIFITLGKDFVILWMGKGFENAYIVAILLIAPLVVIVTQEIANTMLVAMNKIKYDAYCILVTSIISFILSIILTPKMGAIGAAIAIFIGNIIGRIILKNIFFYKYLEISIRRFYMECQIKMSLPILVTIFTGIIISYFIPQINMFIFSIKTLFLVLIYTLSMWFIVLNKSEKDLVLNYAIKFKNKL